MEETSEEYEERFTMIILNLIQGIYTIGLAQKEFSG